LISLDTPERPKRLSELTAQKLRSADVPVSPLRSRLIDRIRADGPLTFAAYMDACLYDPKFGYYSGAVDRRRADYYTSVDVSPVFGRLIARQLEEMWRALGRPTPFTIAEAGAASGTLARNILDFAQEQMPEFYSALRYFAVEMSGPRQELARAALVQHIAAGRASVGGEIPNLDCGCILSNELVDALPVHRVVMTSEGLQEIFVDVEGDGEQLVERELPPSSPEIVDFLAQQNVVLRLGQQAECGLAACHWIEHVGRKLGRGFVLTVDYGHEAPQLFDERHINGTLLAYSRHRVSEDFYRAPGEQDLTSHANFTALDLWGRRVGLERIGFASQMQFLLGLARSNNFADLESEGWSENERTRTRLSFQNLINPEGLGERFRVLIQGTGISGVQLSGLADL
jgi:SAM-dependent MidA family methyltransferase